MSDKRKNNGGHSTKGFAGRKPKAEEQAIIEKLSPLEPLAFKALENSLEEEESWAVKLYFDYVYGKPKETRTVINQEEQPLFPEDVSTDNSSK